MPEKTPFQIASALSWFQRGRIGQVDAALRFPDADGNSTPVSKAEYEAMLARAFQAALSGNPIEVGGGGGAITVEQPETTAPYTGQTITVEVDAVASLTIPNGANRAHVEVVGDPIRWGYNAVATSSSYMGARDSVVLEGGQLAAFRMRAASATPAIVRAEFWRVG